MCIFESIGTLEVKKISLKISDSNDVVTHKEKNIICSLFDMLPHYTQIIPVRNRTLFY